MTDRAKAVFASGGRSELLSLWSRLDANGQARVLELSRELARSEQTPARLAGPVAEAPQGGGRIWVIVALALAISAATYGITRRADSGFFTSVQSSVMSVRDKIAAWSRGWLDFDRDDDEARGEPAPRKQSEWP
nr:hypothetical protein [uncultured Roseococcus sp.]